MSLLYEGDVKVSLTKSKHWSISLSILLRVSQEGLGFRFNFASNAFLKSVELSLGRLIGTLLPGAGSDIVLLIGIGSV